MLIFVVLPTHLMSVNCHLFLYLNDFIDVNAHLCSLTYTFDVCGLSFVLLFG
jgi:hypothetical protein